MFYMLITDTLLKIFPERSQKVKTSLTLWERSENILQMLARDVTLGVK